MLRKYYRYTITDSDGIIILGGIARVWFFRNPLSVHNQLAEVFSSKYGDGNFAISNFARVY